MQHANMLPLRSRLQVYPLGYFRVSPHVYELPLQQYVALTVMRYLHGNVLPLWLCVTFKVMRYLYTD